MVVEKHVVLLDADHAVTPSERDDAMGQLIDRADGAGADGQFWLTYEHVVVEAPDTGPGMFDADGD